MAKNCKNNFTFYLFLPQCHVNIFTPNLTISGKTHETIISISCVIYAHINACLIHMLAGDIVTYILEYLLTISVS